MTKIVGKGTVYIMLAQMIFLGTGYAIHFGLGRVLGPEEYGIFGLILSLLTVAEIFLIRGMRDAVSKYVSEYQENALIIKIRGIKIELILSGIFFILYFLSAEYIAILLNDISLTNYIRLSAMIIPILSVNSVYFGYLSGRREFGKQAISLCIHSFGKVGCVYLFVLLGFGVFGAISGYIIAAFITLIVVSYFSIDGETSFADFSSYKLIKFAIPLVIFSGAISLLMNLDLLFVKALTENNIDIGFYTSALTITGQSNRIARLMTNNFFISNSSVTTQVFRLKTEG